MKAQPQRYLLLDGIRGIAALFVLVRHTADFWGFSFYRSHLAVDVFFILSGFVISSAYGRRLGSKLLTTSDFMRLRAIRLYPMFVISLLLCIVILIAKFTIRGGFEEPVAQVLVTVALTAIFIPSGVIFGGQLFPLNNPYWSLFFELIVNWVYALAWPRIKALHVWAVIVVSAAVMSLAAVDNGSLDVGFSSDWKSLCAGLFRATFGIFLGVKLQSNRNFCQAVGRYLSPAFATLLICAVLASPSIKGFNPALDLVSALLIFPLCIASASTSQETRFDSYWRHLGSSSYPLYLLHYPAWQIMSFVSHGSAGKLAPLGGILIAVILVPTSVFIEKYIDIPIRRKLQAKYPPANASAPTQECQA